MVTKSKRSGRGLVKPGAPKGNQNAKGNRGGGRPSLYHAGLPSAVYRMALLGATDAEMSAVIGVDVSTFDSWKTKHVEFSQALKDGKTAADGHVAQALYHRALGYSHEAVKIFLPAGAEEPVVVPFSQHYPPDTGAAKHWLNNRRPQNWRERVEHAGDPNQPVRFIITRTSISDPEEEAA